MYNGLQRSNGADRTNNVQRSLQHALFLCNTKYPPVVGYYLSTTERLPPPSRITRLAAAMFAYRVPHLAEP